MDKFLLRDRSIGMNIQNDLHLCIYVWKFKFMLLQHALKLDSFSIDTNN